MSILTEFYSLAGPVFAGRAYRNTAPDSPQAPYATFSRVSGVEGNTLDANGGSGNETQTRIQIDIWAAGGVEADALADSLKAALKGWSVPNVLNMEMDGYDDEAKLHRIMLDISTTH